MTIKVPRLARGRGYKESRCEFYGCYNTGTAPAIFHSRTGKYVVGPEEAAREAMRQHACLEDGRGWGAGRRRVWIYKSRGPAVNKFLALCGARILENEQVRQEYLETLNKAKTGDMAAAVALGDF
jgi:hypothetical protein